MSANIHIKLFLIAFVFSAFTTSGYAQSSGKSIKKFTKSFSKSYNAKDHAALTAMFTSDAVRIDTDRCPCNNPCNPANRFKKEPDRIRPRGDHRISHYII